MKADHINLLDTKTNHTLFGHLLNLTNHTMASITTPPIPEWQVDTPTVLVLFREALEAALIVSLLLQFLDRTNRPQYKASVWAGAAAGTVAAIALGAIVIGLYHSYGKNLMQGDTERIFEGIIMVVTSLFISCFGVKMLKLLNFRDDFANSNLARNMDNAITNGKLAIFTMAGSTVLREGIESVVFASAISTSNPVSSMLMSSSIGLALGLLTGVLIHKSSRQLSLTLFKNVMGGMLFLIAAGMLAHGIHELVEKSSGWYNQKLFDLSDCCSDKSEVGAFFRAVFGYQDQPTPAEVMAYTSSLGLFGGIAIKNHCEERRQPAITDSDDSNPAEADIELAMVPT